MAEETQFFLPVGTLEEGPNETDPKEPPAGPHISNTSNENRTLDPPSGPLPGNV